ncbi:hypothetical protein ACIBCR_15370 [Micromonospora echinospora]|uniref:hypothetical protein n=1 Tax=Micromonospora echinospora TaxID=1877 RepID=UPI0037A45F8B
MATATTSLAAAVDLLTELGATPAVAQATAEQAFNDYIHRNQVHADPMADLTAEQRGLTIEVAFEFIAAARLHPNAVTCPDLGQAADYAATAVRNTLTSH